MFINRLSVSYGKGRGLRLISIIILAHYLDTRYRFIPYSGSFVNIIRGVTMSFSKSASWLRRKCANKRLAVFTGLVFVASQGLIAYTIRDLPPEKLVVLQTTFSKMKFLAIIGVWKLTGVLPQFKAHFYFDFFHPVWYGLFLASLIALALNANAISERWNGLMFIPFAAATLDLVENMVHVYFLLDIRRVTDAAVFIGASAACLKWALAGVGVLIVVLLVLRFLAGRISGKTE